MPDIAAHTLGWTIYVNELRKEQQNWTMLVYSDVDKNDHKYRSDQLARLLTDHNSVTICN